MFLDYLRYGNKKSFSFNNYSYLQRRKRHCRMSKIITKPKLSKFLSTKETFFKLILIVN